MPGEDLELVENYGELVRKARVRLGLTQGELARQVGEKATIIKKIEAGEFRPSISLARKLEKSLKVVLLTPAEEDFYDSRKHIMKGGGSKGVKLGDLLRKNG